MSIFLDCFKNNGYDYLRIVDGKRYRKGDGTISNKRTTVKNLGHLKNFDDGKGEGLLFRLREQFKNRTLDIGMDYNQIFTEINEKAKKVIANPITILEPKNLGSLFLDNIFNQLDISQFLNETKSKSKINYDLNGITKLLVFGRILEPNSKKKTFENKDKYLFDVTTSRDINEIYRALDVLDKKSVSIQKRMNTKISQSSIGRKMDLTYYDVTNYYFETMYGDEDTYEVDEEGNKKLDKNGKPIIIDAGLRKKGVSKENRKEPIVGMGLFIDNNGLPVSYSLFPGSTQDKTTFTTMIKESINKNDFGKVVVVADNGMNAQENMYLLVKEENGYIISKSVKASWSKIKEWTMEESEYNKEYNSAGILTFKSKSRIIERTLKDKEGSSITVKEKEIIYWSRKHYERELHQNEKFIEYLESCKENPDKLKDKQRKSQDFIKVVQTDKKTGEVLKTKAVVTLLEDKIEKYKETMGYYSIVTSEIEMDDKEIINRYHGLSRIEDSFRIMKSELEARPVYVWTKEHINAHFLICFIALTIIRIIQYKVLKSQGKETLNIEGWEQGITTEKLKNALNNFQANHIGNGYYQLSQINEGLALIVNSLDLNMELTLPDLSQINGLKKKIASSRL